MNTKKQLNIVHMQYYSLENQYFMWIQILMNGEHTAGIKAHELCLPLATSCKCNGAGSKGHVLCPERLRDTLHLGGIPTKAPVAQQDKVESCHMTPAWHLQLLERVQS